ncbi:MAG TPA: UMP kinase [archaeon]|nr:UMP kinase [archaeon]
MLPEFFNVSEDSPARDSAETQERSFRRKSSEGIFVVSIGGSLLFENGIPNPNAIRDIADAVSSLHSEGFDFALVIGGGVLARDFVEAGEAMGANNFELDSLGIAATRLNALLFINALESAHSEVLTDIKKADEIISSGKIPVFGGLIPGVTTDFCAAIIAEHLNAGFINLSNVEGIFDSNPAKNKDAKLFRELSCSELLEILIKEESKPRQNIIIDIPAVLVLKRSHITGFFLSGNSMENFKAAVRNQDFEGTIVSEAADSGMQPEESPLSEEPEDWEEAGKKKTRKKPSKRLLKKPRRKKRGYDADDIAMRLKF